MRQQWGSRPVRRQVHAGGQSQAQLGSPRPGRGPGRAARGPTWRATVPVPVSRRVRWRRVTEAGISKFKLSIRVWETVTVLELRN